MYPEWLKTDHKLYWKHENLGVRDDIEGRSQYVHYQPTKDQREQAMERYWRKKRNKELAEKREAEEHVRYMIAYSQAKSRIKEETGRKCEAMSFGTNFGQKEFQYSKDVRAKKEAKAARNIYDSSSESSIDPDSASDEEEEEEEEEGP